ncbi:MAG: 5'-nucleotidase C-terminal domain-containing protein [Corallococcus sp.]|nr:5'-nucleotidase C-terminal domain-containing protein [Corallococcus sp.]MCM1358921.1 5'-nucleotidase C-terminal domain-containing protein [Corallococcus sp.]MCM1394909.1 5'-nucleotidase C-terminal domain-containing protein [Corallococcus sp.]
MKNKRLLLAALCVVFTLCLLLAACTIPADKTLNTPVVNVDDNGVASWSAVPNAVGYKYKINGGEEIATDGLSVQLTNGQSISVKAVGDGKTYKDSAYSTAKTYSKAEPTLLGTPVVSVSNSGVASWAAVTNASGYKYKIDGGAESFTNDLSVKLTDGQSISVKAVGDGVAYSDGEYCSPITYTAPPVPDDPEILNIPVVTITSDGIASWSADPNADGYKYKVDGGAEVATGSLFVQLTDGQSIVVKACGDGVYYADSAYCASQTYVAPKTLRTPVVSIASDGTASWTAVSNASGYKYVINGGVERSTVETSISLTHKDTIKVKTVGDGETYLDSEFSAVQTYLDPNAPANCTHVDNDNDTICDVCNESVITNLAFYSFNDLHGQFKDSDSQPGLDEFTTYIKNLYADNAQEEILLSAGDMWQGSVESSSTKGKLMTTWMNEVGFSAMALGNHEFDWGLNSIKEAAEIANFPILGINVTVNGSQPDYIKSSVIVEKGGVKVGIIGAIGNCLSSISGEFTTGLSFATGNSLTNLVKQESDRLRNTEGCDFIVYAIHDGRGQSYSNVQNFTSSDFHDGSDSSVGKIYYDTSLSDGYVDLVFESHTHQSYILRDEYGVYHMQAGGYNQAISNVNVSYNTVTKQVVSVSPNKIPSSIYGASNINDDPVVEQIYKQFFPDSDPYTTVLGTTDSYRSSTEICDQLAELYYQVGQAEWGDQYDIVLGGGFLKARSPYNLYAGNVTYAQIFSILPFDNSIVLGSISGSKLKSQFINSTNSDYHCYYPGITASSISDSKTYYIIVDTYSAYYSRNGITEVARLSSGKFARDLLSDFISVGGWGSGSSSGGNTGGNTGGNVSGTNVSISDALAIGNALADGATTEETYVLTGMINELVSTTYGNFYITDGTDTFYIYGLYSADGLRYDAMDNPPQVGDTVTVSGQIYKYVSAYGTTIEIKNARLQSVA